MRLVKSITQNKFLSLSIILLCGLSTQAQDNAPYSRYGLGTMVPRTNMVNRGMGGVSAGYFDYQSLNFVNPAAFGGINSTIFDLGGEIDFRTLKSNLTPAKYTSANTTISYLQFGVPIATKKMMQKNNYWGLSFGLRPLTRISYKIEDNKRLAGVDSVQYLYEGSGGLNQASLGTGIKIKGFSAGIALGYNFGNKDYSTRVILINDSVPYYKGNSESITTFNSLSFSGGIQYEMKVGKEKDNKRALLRLGAYGNLGQKLNATQETINETFSFDGTGGTFTVDTVEYKNGKKGKINYPLNYGFGFTYTDRDNHWTFGADFENTMWSDYSFYGQSENLQDNYTLRVGGQYYGATPSTLTKNYFRFVKYRAGLYYGNEQISIAGDRKDFGVTAGAGFPLTSLQRIRYGEYAVLNTGIEFGAIGNKNSGNIRENVLRFSFGVSMNARWFQKRKYD